MCPAFSQDFVGRVPETIYQGLHIGGQGGGCFDQAL